MDQSIKIDKKIQCEFDFYRFLDTIDINQVSDFDFYRFIDWQNFIDFYRLTTPGVYYGSPGGPSA